VVGPYVLLNEREHKMPYTFQTVVVDGAADGTWLGGINNAGIATGYDAGFGFDHYGHAFTYTNGAFTPIEISKSLGNGINNAGQVAGSDGGGTTRTFGFLWSPDGSSQEISSVPDQPSQAVDKAYGVNDAGQVVGVDLPFQHKGFVWQNGSFSFFQVPNAATEGHGINNAGVIVGTANNYGFIDNGGQFSLFGLGAVTEVNAINNSNVVAGDYFDGNHWHGFIDDGTMHFIDAPGASETHIEGINDAGTISGYLTPAAGGPVQGFIATDPPADPVTTLVREEYVGLFGHDASSGAQTFWTDELKAGALTPRDFMYALTQSAESQALHGGQTDAQFVDSIYHNALGRAAEPNTQTVWASVMGSSGGPGRWDVSSAIATSPEGQIHFAATHG
jgi:hypothetical protein